MKLRGPVLALALLAAATPAAAHPESPLLVRLILGMEAGKVRYLGESWTFDSPTSAWLLDTFDTDGSGAFEAGELPALQAAVRENVAPSLFCTRAFAGGREIGPMQPYGFQASVAQGAVSVAFALGLPAPVAPDDLRVEMEDPAAFLAITPVARQPVVFRGDSGPTCVPKMDLNQPDPEAEGLVIAIRLTLSCTGG
jgi:ABC-type uncharacterized transport system substrate-binding protein